MAVPGCAEIAQEMPAPHGNRTVEPDSATLNSPISENLAHSGLSTARLHRFFREVSADASHAAMLGGSAEPSPLNRGVIIGLHARQSLVLQDNTLILNGKRTSVTSETLWQTLESARTACRRWAQDQGGKMAQAENLLMTGGLIAAFGYDFARWCDPGWQPQPSDVFMPDLLAFEFEDWIILDLAIEDAGPVILSDSDERKASYEAAWQACHREAPLERKRLPECLLNEAPEILEAYLDTFHPSLDQPAFERTVERIKDGIRRGEIYQANLSLRLEKTLQLDPLALFELLCTRNPSPFSAYLHWPDSVGKRCAIVSNSPERLVSMDASGMIQARPIAGTRGRGQSQDEDATIGDILLANPKERAEHLMLVDLARNDLGRVCSAGSVSVDELFVLERYSHVTHLVSNVRGNLSPNYTGWDLLRAVFPGGTITGCPKLRCMEMLDELESVPRGFYTGSLGWMDAVSPALDLNILIRSVFLQQADEAGLRYNAAVHVGAGIVHDAVPAHEYRECLRKATATLAALYALENQGDSDDADTESNRNHYFQRERH